MSKTAGSEQAERINALQAEIRQLRWVLAAVLLVGGLSPLAWWGVHSSRPVEVPGLAITDERGTVRVRIGAIDEDSLVYLYDRSGSLQMGFSATPHGPVVGLYGADGQAAASLTVGGDGGQLLLFDAKGKRNVLLPENDAELSN